MHQSIVHKSFEFSVNILMIDRLTSPGWGRIPAVAVENDVGMSSSTLKSIFNRPSLCLGIGTACINSEVP